MNHTIKCLNPNCIGGRIQTTMEGDSGYSNYTVMDSGFIEFKCTGCGKFSSTDWNKKNDPANQPANFEITCNQCGHTHWTAHVQDVDHDDPATHITCDKCQVVSVSL
jgi:ribosomal protein S27E